MICELFFTYFTQAQAGFLCDKDMFWTKSKPKSAFNNTFMENVILHWLVDSNN